MVGAWPARLDVWGESADLVDLERLLAGSQTSANYPHMRNAASRLEHRQWKMRQVWANRDAVAHVLRLPRQ